MPPGPDTSSVRGLTHSPVAHHARTLTDTEAVTDAGRSVTTPRRDDGTNPMSTYGQDHRRTRAQWAPLVDTGHITCSRHTQDPQCPGLITPGTPWDLDHTDDHTGNYLGPAHETCNARAGALKRLGRLPTPDTIHTYPW